MSTSVSTDASKTAAPVNTSAYYPFMENTGNLREWSVTQIQGESLWMKPVGAGAYVLSLALSVVEAALMTIVNLAIVLKNCLTCNCWSSEEAPKVDDAQVTDASKVDATKVDATKVDATDETEKEEEPSKVIPLANDGSVEKAQPKITVTSNAGKGTAAAAVAAGLAWLTGAAVAAPIAIPLAAAAATGVAVKSGFDIYHGGQFKAAPAAPAPKPVAKAKVKAADADAE